MRYHWIRDQVRQKKFRITWDKGENNLADYFTKAHPVKHVVNMRRLFVQNPPKQHDTPHRDTARTRRVAKFLQQQLRESGTVNTTPQVHERVC